MVSRERIVKRIQIFFIQRFKMIIIKHDSELMRNYVAANPVPAGERFAVFKDLQEEPAVLALSDDSRLNLVMVVNGSATKIDFEKSSGIAKDGVKVQAFAVKQASDTTLDICITTEASNNKSNFWLLHGIKPADLLEQIPTSKITRGTFPSVRHIFMVCSRPIDLG